MASKAFWSLLRTCLDPSISKKNRVRRKSTANKRNVYENVILSLFIDTLLPRPHSKRESYIHIICIFYCPSKLVILSSI